MKKLMKILMKIMSNEMIMKNDNDNEGWRKRKLRTQQDNAGCGADVGGLASHVWARDNLAKRGRGKGERSKRNREKEYRRHKRQKTVCMYKERVAQAQARTEVLGTGWGIERVRFRIENRGEEVLRLPATSIFL